MTLGADLLTASAGLAVGILIGLTGIGGGAIMTPFLILVLKIDPVLAVGTDLVFASVTKWLSGIQHRRQHNVSLRMVAWLALGSMPTSLLLSSFVLLYLSKDSGFRTALAKVLGVVLIAVSFYTLSRLFGWIKVDEGVRWPPAWALVLIGAFGGCLVGLTSVGSGSIILAALMIFFAIPSAKLVGMDVMHGALLTTLPALVYIHGGQVRWPVVVWLLLGSIPGAWLGTRLIKVVPQNLVRGALSVLLVAAGVRLFL